MKNLDKFKDDLVCLEDGFSYYWVTCKGALSSANLREIADYLDLINEPQRAAIESLFSDEEK